MVAIRAALAIALCGCNFLTDSFVINEFSGDSFPIDVDSSTGAIIIGVRESDRTTHTAIIDVLSPLTVIDRGPDEKPRVDDSPLVLLGQRAGSGTFDVPRARFVEPQVVSMHPCPDAVCTIGTPAAPRPFDAIIGADAFAGDALRLRLAPTPGADRIFVLPDIAGDGLHRSRACDAVFANPFRGGGTILIGGTELAFGNWRIALGVCIAPDPTTSKPQRQRGTDALLVVSTAIGPSLLNRSAYERYHLMNPATPSYDALAETDTVLLPAGPITGRKTTLPSLALVAQSGSTSLAPCREVYAHHLLVAQDCAAAVDCPCSEGDSFCAVPAVIELAPTAGIEFLIIDDADPTLHALRTELRPDRPEVDGILGTAALRTLEVDIDYPNNRLLGRCTASAPQCSARPELAEASDRPSVTSCIGP